MTLNETHLSELSAVSSMAHMGGAAPVEYRQWRRFEAMRAAKLLKFHDRRRVRWDLTFYQITDKGRAVLAQ